MKVAPDIPQSVVYMSLAFDGCEQLTEAPRIPDGVSSLEGAFCGCKKLVEAPKIPESVSSLQETFTGCESLTTAPEIPKSVNHLEETFAGCTAMEGTLVCHANPTTFENALRGTQIPAIEGSCSEETKIKLMGTNGNKALRG